MGDDVTEAAVHEEESGESEESNGEKPVDGGINEEVDDNNGVDTKIVAEDGNEDQDDGAEAVGNEEESGESGESNGEKTVDGEINEEVDGNNGVDTEIVAEDGNEDQDDVTEAAVNEEESGEREENNGDEPVDGEINEEVDGNNGVDNSYTEIVVEDGNEAYDEADNPVTEESGVYTEMVPGTGLKVG